MRSWFGRLELVAAVGAALAIGCNGMETNQPLTVVGQQPGGAPAGAGPSGGAGGQSTPDPRCCTDPTGAAGTGAAGVGGDAGTGAAGVGGDAGTGATCWASQLPPEPQAPQPKLDVATACQLAANATSWSFPTTWTGTNAMHNDDHDGDLVGRWVTCGGAGVVSLAHAGIEFAGNGRWRLLAKDASGALVPLPTGGYYYVLGSGQLNLDGESPADNTVGAGGFVTFAEGNPDVVRFDSDGVSGGSSTYARVAPSPTNGDDNAPSVSDGHCSMVGSWDVPANDAAPAAPASRWTFDVAGHFVVDAPGADLCAAHTQWGLYRLSTDGLFQITQNWNLGLCDWWFSAAYPYEFSADCSTLTLTQQWDNCTGGRGYLNGTTMITREK
jgi:hypothetical protein